MKKEIKDEDIIEDIINGNIDLFSIIVERYEKKLKNYIYKITNVSNHDVDDLLQDIFIKIYKNLNNYNNSYKFSNWVYKISYNYVVDNYKKIKKRKINELPGEELKFENNDGNIISLLDIIEDKEQNIEGKLINNELKGIILKSISMLEYKYKNVLILRYFNELSYDEISDIMEMPINTIGTLVNRAKKQLKKELLKAKIYNYL